MKKRYYAALLIVSLATVLLLAGAPSWLAVSSLTAISIVLYVMERKELPEEALVLADLDRDDLAILRSISEGNTSIRAISKDTGISWHTIKRRMQKLSDLGLVETINGQEIGYSLSPDGELLLKVLPSHFLTRVSSESAIPPRTF